ncbi:MAG TPA: beta-ketoacyl synthase N-terminal-like domain-containing protein, partial [Blastocatellia bacterium]|nr:beta-ketoacyl synthase N-terminal-like domain-containing protein [Blastocatellia bacterium]
MSDWNETNTVDNLDVAIIGMECRFPGARNIEEFWRNLRDGVESIQLFSDDTLKGFGVDPDALSHPSFIKAGALIEDSDKFDAAFFGYSPREAELMDPQQRVFLECAWSALESAGYSSENFPGLIGVYAGTSMSTYLLYNVFAQSVDPQDSFQVMIENDKDFLSTRVSYELNLKGPSVDVQTACSTSLVATHLACQSLISYQCDMALAGGVSVQVPQRTGYYYQEGGISSPDGHCRAFDAQAQGTIFGSGVGIVVLKRLADAINDGDRIHAVIKGSAINNDGAMKVGYTAPSVEGQSQVISMAQQLAGVEAETISYIEAHGTGTPLGDPVEVEALTKAFRASTQKKGFCALGSVKTNIGHLDAAAGVAGLIKAVLALRHAQIPPTLHYRSPNPNIDFPQSPFYVNPELKPWPPESGPRRAGVSSFGVGGTNAHLVLEQAPEREPGGEARAWQVLTVSAKSRAGLDEATDRLRQYLGRAERGGVSDKLADVAYTLQVGRAGFDHRRV